MTWKPRPGIHAALVTAFNDDDSLNLAVQTSLIEDQIEAGIAGLLVNGSTGEFAALTTDERHLVAEHAIKTAGGRADVMVGIGSVNTVQSRELAEHALTSGADAGLLVMPYYEPLSAAEQFEFTSRVADVGLPIVIYNNPGATGECMSVDFIAELSTIPNVVGVKDTTTEPRRLFELAEVVYADFAILGGHDTSQVFALLAGFPSVVWGAPNVDPRSCVALWDLAFKQRNLEATLAFWREIRPIMAFLETHDYMAANKAGAVLRGIDVGVPRRPIAPLSNDDMKLLRGAMDRAGAALSELRRAQA